MELDWAHMVATAGVIFVVMFIINNIGAFEAAGRGKRAIIGGAVIFVAVLTLNLLWPYGAT